MTTRFLLFCLLGVTGCGTGGDILDDVDPAVLAAEPTFTDTIQPLFAHYCIGCHSSYGPRMGGVELDRYDSAFSGRVRNICTAIRPELVERYADLLMRQETDPPLDRGPCEHWEPYTMPFGAKSRLTIHEQVLLIRWLETGAPK